MVVDQSYIVSTTQNRPIFVVQSSVAPASLACRPDDW